MVSVFYFLVFRIDKKVFVMTVCNDCVLIIMLPVPMSKPHTFLPCVFFFLNAAGELNLGSPELQPQSFRFLFCF